MQIDHCYVVVRKNLFVLKWWDCIRDWFDFSETENCEPRPFGLDMDVEAERT